MDFQGNNMFVESIELKNYRNYGSLSMVFDPGTNVLYGDNAQGKTNVLEAVYVCATTKSHRGSKDKEIIRFAEDESHIKMNIRNCLLYTSPSPRDGLLSRMPSSA